MKSKNFRTVKLMAGLTQEFEIINTNAPDSVIKAQVTYINACEDIGKPIDNPYGIIESMGYVINIVGCQDDFDSDDLDNMTIDAVFDYYDF